MMRQRRDTAALALLLGGFLGSAPAAAENYQWVQYGLGGPEIRAMTTGVSCPLARIDGIEATMAVRAAPGEGYPVTSCQLAVPAGSKSATVAGVPVALPVADPKRIVIIGDTGCRMKGKAHQACNDPVQWPARLVAETAAQMKPDLVIHAGDYHYRETPCPADDMGCAGSPVGDTWAVWQADFFAPMATLLRTVPWVAVRGNHEECDRGGKGWSRSLEAYSFDAVTGCNGLGATFPVALSGLTLAVMDVSTAEEAKVEDAQVEAYRAKYAELAKFGPGPVWVLQHRPIWSGTASQGGALKGDNKTLAAAAFGSIPATVTVMISGHHHLFQALNYEGDLPAQIVAGHGGDNLNKGQPQDPAGFLFGSAKVRSGLDMPGSFGFAMLEKTDVGSWRLTNHDRFGRVLATCTIVGREISCPKS